MFQIVSRPIVSNHSSLCLSCPKMSQSLKPDQIRIRIEKRDADLLDVLAGEILSRTDVASLLLHAALDAIREANGEISFPPKFNVPASERAAPTRTRIEIIEPRPLSKKK